MHVLVFFRLTPKSPKGTYTAVHIEMICTLYVSLPSLAKAISPRGGERVRLGECQA